MFPKVTVEGISRRMLTLNLRKLERDGLHGRSTTATPSPRPAGSTTVNAGNAERSCRALARFLLRLAWFDAAGLTIFNRGGYRIGSSGAW